MGGRMYDPRIARFLSADPLVQAPDLVQNYDRYSYVLNNPMNYVDPTGYSWLSDNWRMIASIGVTFLMPIALNSWFAIAEKTFTSAVLTGATSGAVSSGSLKGALQGAFSAGISLGIGNYFDPLASSTKAGDWAFNDGRLTFAGQVAKGAALAVNSGLMSVMNGGKFGHSFMTAGVTQVLSPFSVMAEQVGGASAGYITHIVIGGTVSAISGGKFANGATSAAFAVAFAKLSAGAEVGGEGEWLVPEGGPPDINSYVKDGKISILTNGILGNKEDFQRRVNDSLMPGYFNPSQSFVTDIAEATRQRLFGGSGDPLSAGFARGLVTARHPLVVYAHSQGTLTVVAAIRFHGLSPNGSTFVLRSPALTYRAAARVIRDAGGHMEWDQPWFDIANTYTTLNPLRWASGFVDILLGARTHINNGKLPGN